MFHFNFIITRNFDPNYFEMDSQKIPTLETRYKFTNLNRVKILYAQHNTLMDGYEKYIKEITIMFDKKLKKRRKSQ
jgi:hypothetical protein